MEEMINNNSEAIQDLQRLKEENVRLRKAVDEKNHKIKGFEDQVLSQSSTFSILYNYSIDLANKCEEEIYTFISSRFKSFFDVKEVWISIYDEKDKVLILKGTTLTKEDNIIIVKKLGRNILGFRTPVPDADYRAMIESGVGEPSSLHEISFGNIPLLISRALERLFNVGWLQGVALTDKGKLYGALVVAGYKNQEPLSKEKLKAFTEITSNVLRRKQDLTELREAKEMLSLERNLLRSLIDNLPDRIYAKDASCRFIICNEALVKRMGKDSADEIIGKSDKELMDKESALISLADEQNIIKTGIPQINKEERVLFKNGQLRYSLSTKIPLRNSNNEIVGIVGIGRDITKRKLLEIEAANKNEQLQKIIADRDRFFSIIAHDLKSPFNYFLGFTELISDQIDSMSKDKIKEIAINMRRSAVNNYSLLENLLEWSKMQRGLFDFKPQEFYLLDRTRECVGMIIGPANKKGIAINVDVPNNLVVIADNHMFDAIIRNLVSNAIKFSNRGGNIVISAYADNDSMVEIRVSDNGIGMDDEIVGNLFIRNDKTRRKGTDDEPSTGLGLLLCKEFIEKHGGKIWVNSQSGKGSTFAFSINGRIKVKG